MAINNQVRPIRVLQVLTIMNRGGAEAMVMNYYRVLDRSKVQFDFLLHRKEKGAYDDEIERLGGKIYRLSNISLSNIWKYKAELNDFFKANPEYQIVHSHLNALSYFVLSAAKKSGIPIRIAHSHTSLFHINLNPFSKNFPPFPFLYKFIVQNILKHSVAGAANHYFACGEKAGRWLFGKRVMPGVRYIPNAIPSEIFEYNPKKAALFKNQVEVSEDVVIGHVGNFVPEKNHLFILSIFQESLELNPEVVLLLVGGGNGMDEIKNLAKKMNIDHRIRFMGVRKDVPDLLQAMDVFLFPSTNEGLPVTLVEAQAAGLHIIASEDITKDLDLTGNVTFFSLKRSAEEWANKLLEIAKKPRVNTREKIINGSYDIKVNAQNLMEFYIKNLTK